MSVINLYLFGYHADIKTFVLHCEANIISRKSVNGIDMRAAVRLNGVDESNIGRWKKQKVKLKNIIVNALDRVSEENNLYTLY